MLPISSSATCDTPDSLQCPAFCPCYAVAEDTGQTLFAAIEPGIAIKGDRALITQMIANLIENAIRHTPAGARIELRLERSPGGPLGFVSDTGPGIPPNLRDKVFRRFYRLERSRSSAGSGLGLALVMAVAELHGTAIALADARPGLEVRLDFAAAATAGGAGGRFERLADAMTGTVAPPTLRASGTEAADQAADNQ